MVMLEEWKHKKKYVFLHHQLLYQQEIISCFHLIHIAKYSHDCYNNTYKYEQIVNRTFFRPKMLIVRIFCELHVKIGLGNQCLCGFWEDTVEMILAR